jgi:hypothetical protein
MSVAAYFRVVDREIEPQAVALKYMNRIWGRGELIVEHAII